MSASHLDRRGKKKVIETSRYLPFALKCIPFAQSTRVKKKLYDLIMATKTSLLPRLSNHPLKTGLIGHKGDVASQGPKL